MTGSTSWGFEASAAFVAVQGVAPVELYVGLCKTVQVSPTVTLYNAKARCYSASSQQLVLQYKSQDHCMATC